MSYGLGQLILDRRRELGLSQQELARRIGIPTANLSSLEHTVSRWQSRLVVALSRELGLPQIELALAAGIINDLPPLAEHEIIDEFAAALGGYRAETEPFEPPLDPVVLGETVARLSPTQQTFLAVLVRQLLARNASGAAAHAGNGVG